jgi:DNA-binding transcriptional regulator YhcF (GntR family)
MEVSSMFKLAPNNLFEAVKAKLATLSEKELQAYIEQARKIGLSEEQIQQGIAVLNSLRKNS